MSDTKKEKEGWYPGKFVGRRKSTAPKTSSPSGASSTPSSEVEKSKMEVLEEDLSQGNSSPSIEESQSSTSSSDTPDSKTIESSPSSKSVEKETKQIAKSEATTPVPKVSSRKSVPPSSGGEKSKEGWYPGKYIGVKQKDSGSSKQSSFIRNRFPMAGKPPVKTVGNVIIKILGVKHMSATRPSFEVWLDRQVETFQFMSLEHDGSSTEEFEGFYSLGDLTSDIIVLVKEDYSVGKKSQNDEENFVGRVVIPISSYLTLKTRLPPKKEWMAIYPIANAKQPMEAFQSGITELPGSAMPKSKQSLGFLCVQIELLLPEGPVYNMYLEGEPPRKPHRVLSSAEDNDSGPLAENNATAGPVDDKHFEPEKFFRICQRLQFYFSAPPAVFSPVLKFPEVFVLIALFGFLCFGADASNLPLIMLFLIGLNGILSKKTHDKVVLWNEMLEHKPDAVLADPHTGKSLPLSMKKSPEYVYQHLQEPLYDCQVFLEKLTNFLEIMSNIWNFSDIRVSALFYGLLSVITLFSTLVIIIFSARLLLFILGSAILLLNSVRDIFPELFSLDQLYDLLISEENDGKFQSVRNFFAKFWLAYSRVPNQNMLVHRHIARTCVVDEDGEEMKDAALKMKNM